MAEKARPAERGVARQRPVAVAFEHLDPPSGNVPARIGVELFDGMIVVVDFVRIDRRGPGNYTWHGRVDGYDKSEAVLTVVDGNIAGTISLVDSAARIAATYQLQTNRDGTQSLRQIDPSGFPTDHPPGSEKLRAPVPEKAAPRSSRGDIELKGGAIAAADTGATIDVMVVYSKQTAAAAGTAIGAQIQQAIDSANAAYANSGITTRLNLVHTAAVNYDESGDFNTDLNRLTSGSDGYMDEVATLRNTHGADLVSLFIENGQYCGIAWIGPSASYGFSVINRGCASGNLSFAHELGHNFGALHDPYVDPGTSPYAYGHGYAVPAAGWRTVMAYNNVCSAAGTSCTRIPYFSNPNLTYGSPAQALGTAATSDNARVHNQNAATVANFRTSGTSSCTFAFSPSSASVAATATSGSTSVTAGTGCAWTTTSNASWLDRRMRVPPAAAPARSTTRPRPIAARRAAARSRWVGSTSPSARRAAAPTRLSASSASFAASGGNGSVNLTTGAGCTWTVSSSATWLTVSSAKSGSGSTTVSFAAAANTSTSTLSANLAIGGATFVVTEAASIPLPPTTYQVSGTVMVGASALAGVSFCQRTASARCTSTDVTGRYACTVPPRLVGHGDAVVGWLHVHAVLAQLQQCGRQPDRAGLRGSGRHRHGVGGGCGAVRGDVVGDNDAWKWVSSNPAPYSGALAHQSTLVAGSTSTIFTTPPPRWRSASVTRCSRMCTWIRRTRRAR